MSKEAKVICKNIFKNSDEKNFTKEYNQKWLKLINEFEKNKKKCSV